MKKTLKNSKKAHEESSIEDKKSPSKDNSRDKLLIFTLVGVILVFLALFVAIQLKSKEKPIIDEPLVKTFNGYTFTQTGSFWVTKIQLEDTLTGKKSQYEIMFHYTPDEVESIPTEKNIRNESITPNLLMNVRKIYITTEPNYPSTVILGGVEIAKILAQVYRKEVKSALTKNSSNTAVPIITCEDLNETQRVVYLKIGNETKIYSDNGCIVVQGKNETEVIRASERLAYEMIKIL